MFNNLSEKLDKALHVLKGHGRISEINVAETLKAHPAAPRRVPGNVRPPRDAGSGALRGCAERSPIQRVFALVWNGASFVDEVLQ